MSRSLAVAVAGLLLIAPTHADITAYLTPWTDITLTSGPAFYADLYVSVTAADDWTVCTLDAELDADYTFFQASSNDGNPPNPDYFSSEPDSEYTCFYTTPGDWPNAPYNGGVTILAYENDSPHTLSASWFDTIDTGSGTFMVARITVLGANPHVPIGQGMLSYASVNDPTMPVLSFTIPEPATLVALTLLASAAMRRR